MSSLNNFKSKIEEFRKQMRETYDKLLEKYKDTLEDFKKIDLSSKDKLVDLYVEVKRIRVHLKHEFQNLYREFKKTIHDFKRDLRVFAPELPEDHRKTIGELRDLLAETARDLKKYVGLAHDLENSFREFEFQIKNLLATKPLVRKSPIEGLSEALEETLKEVFSSTEKILSKATEVVSSIRIPESDAKLIKLLVDAGIFKSRNEALAYFAHKGIEASRDWLNRVQERLQKIRELQEEIRKELGKIFEEESK